jgi:RNA polymerase sigma-70 factor (ECF subfamily)
VELTWRQGPVEAIGADIAEAVVDRLDTDAALHLVAQLSPLQAEVIVLRAVADLPVEDVARIVGRTPGAVRVAAHRGLSRLEKILAPQRVTTPGAGSL